MNKFGSTHAPDATYQVSRSSAFWFWRRRFFEVFTINGHGGHLGHVTMTIWTKFRFPHPKEALYEIWLQSAMWFRGEDIWKCWHTYIHTYIRMTQAHLYYKLTYEAEGSGELIKVEISGPWNIGHWPTYILQGRSLFHTDPLSQVQHFSFK